MAKPTAFSVTLLLFLCVCTQLCSSSLVHVAAAVPPSPSSSSLHLRRLADNATECSASASSSTFASYLAVIPETAGLRGCASANINDIISALSAKDSTCSLTTLVALFSSKTDSDVNDFMDFLGGLLSGLSSSSSSSSSTSTAAPTASSSTASVSSFLSSWSKNATKTQGFCNAMNKKVGPCAQTLIPALFSILRKGPKCCDTLLQYVDVLNLVVPAGKGAEQMLFDLVNGLHKTMCTVSGTSSLCGQSLIEYLATADSKAQSLLVSMLFTGGLPLYALPDSDTCAALDATNISSRIVSGSSIPYFASSCCSAGLASLLEAVDVPLARLVGNTVPEILNLITAKQDLKEAQQFKSFYDTIKSCSFATKCTDPSFVLPTNYGLAVTESSAGLTAKTAQPKGVACTKVDVCDSKKVCSSVCSPGSVMIAPWAARALTYQRNASYDKSLCYTELPATHNSAMTIARGYGNRDQLVNKVLSASNSNSYLRTNNQLLSVEDQLRIGVRFLETDVHYFAGNLHSAHCSNIKFSLIQDASTTLVSGLTSILSGGKSDSSVVVEWDAALFGCLPSLSGIRAEEQRLFSDTLKDISTWLKSNTNDLLVLYTEIGAEVTTFSKLDGLLKLYTDNFGDLIFSPADLKAMGGSWNEFTLSELIGKGKRIILVTTPTANDLMFKMTTLCDGWSDIPGGKIGTGALWDKKYNTGSLVRAFESALHYATLTEDDLAGKATPANSSTEPTELDASTLPIFVNAGVNVLAPDLLDGAMIQAMIWTWAEKEPTKGDTAVEVSAADGRWYGVVDKSTIKNVACVSTSDRSSWKIVAQGASCPTGFVTGVPALAIENAALVTALKATGVTATAQLSLDISNFPTISEADEKVFESGSSTLTPSSSLAGGSSSSTPTTKSAGISHAVEGQIGTMCFSVLVAILLAGRA